MNYLNVIVVSDTIQQFAGERFYLCGEYFQHGNKRLHLAVYEYFNGVIPKGYHVHHKDDNKHNNDISNLGLMTAHDHISKHMQSIDKEVLKQRFIDSAIPKAAEWHHSEEGKQWHSEQAKKVWLNRVKNKLTCQYCGKEFESYNKTAKFCSNNCKCTSYRKRAIAI